jgi:hypothetical protein
MVVPLLLATTLLACQPGDDAGVGPSLAGAASRSPTDFFFLTDPDRDYSATIGLISEVADLNTNPDCGGAGPRIVDTGIENVVFTPTGSAHFRDSWHQATLVLYDGATGDVCELSSHAVLGRGQVNFRFSVRDADVNDPTVNFYVQMTGLVDLTGGGRAQVLLTANFYVDDAGNAHIRTDRFELKPLGK